MKLTDEQLRSLEQWAAIDLSSTEEEEIFALVAEVRELRGAPKEALDAYRDACETLSMFDVTRYVELRRMIGEEPTPGESRAFEAFKRKHAL